MTWRLEVNDSIPSAGMKSDVKTRSLLPDSDSRWNDLRFLRPLAPSARAQCWRPNTHLKSITIEYIYDMAEFFLNRMLFARLRATRTATGAKPVPRHQPDTETAAFHEEEKEDATTQATEDPEEEVDEGAERVPAAKDAGDDTDTLRNPSGDRDVLATWTAIINNLWKRAADNATILAAQARDTALDAVNKMKELGFIGTAKAIGHWMRLNPWKTALLVVPLVMLACTAIVLSATGFGPAGIVAGT